MTIAPRPIHEKRNILLLAACQALALSGSILLFTIAALVSRSLVDDESIATLPLAILQLATMLTTIPASLLMKRIGRPRSFMIGAGIGFLGAAIATYAVFHHSFAIFCVGTLLFGSYNGFAGFYRFAAADAASDSFRSRAISWVVAGGLFAGLFAPMLATWSRYWVASFPFAGTLAFIMVLQGLTWVALQWIDLPPMATSATLGQGRPLSRIMRQPIFMVAVLGSMLGYGIMALLMTATPLAMTHHDHSFASTAVVIQWHVLGMFFPSFFTGSLIARFGILNILLAGVGLNILCVGFNLLDTQFMNFWTALFLLGIGWNFLFVGSTTLLTEVYMPIEKAKTQAAHDFIMFSFVALATFSAGALLNRFDWQGVNYVVMPLLLLLLAGILWLRLGVGYGRAIAKEKSPGG